MSVLLSVPCWEEENKKWSWEIWNDRGSCNVVGKLIDILEANLAAQG